MNVGGGEDLKGEDLRGEDLRGGDGEDVKVCCSDFTDANVVPHLVLLPLDGNEGVPATGLRNCAPTLLSPEESSPMMSSSSCTGSSFWVFFCCSSSKAIHCSLSRFFSATSRAVESDATGVHSVFPSWSSNLSGLASRRFCAELVDRKMANAVLGAGA